MGEIKDEATHVYRDFTSTGVSSSGRQEPRKTDIRRLFELVDVVVYAAQAGLATAADIDARDTFFSDAANQEKLVYVNNNNGADNDPSNGVYEYVGGAPRLAIGFYQGLASVVQPLVNQIGADAASVSAALAGFFETDIIGRPVDPVDALAGSVNTRLFNDPVTRSGRIRKVRLFSSLTGSNTATLKVKVITRDAGPGVLATGDALTLVDGATLTITGGGLKEFDVDIPVEAGQFIGWYHSVTGAVDFTNLASSDSGGFWWDNGKTGDNSTMVATSSSSNFQWQIGFDVEVQIVTKETDRKASFAYDVAMAQVSRKGRPIPAIPMDMDWAMCLSADFIDADQEVGTSDRLLEWLDRSGNGNSPATTTLPRPVYDADAFGPGIPGLQFVGGNDGGTGELRVMYLQGTMVLTQPFTVIAIVMLPSINSAELRLVEGFNTVGASDRASLGMAAGGKPYIGVAPEQTIVSPDAISAAEPHLLIGTYGGPSSSISVDGVVKATGTIDANLDGLILGSGRDALAIWNGAVGLLGYVNGTLSTSQLAAVEAYAADRYGITFP